jgi:hypothetical protein
MLKRFRAAGAALAALAAAVLAVGAPAPALALSAPQKLVVTSGAPPLSFSDLIAGQTFAFIGAPCAINKTWAASGYPTVEVERGWGSGVIQKLYSDNSCNLWTKPRARGQKASAFAGSAILLVNKIYNQAGTNPANDYAPALANDKRVILNVATAGAPFFAGVATGTQDPNQNATQRGYALPASVSLKTNDHPLSLIAAHQHAASGDIEYLVQDTAATPTRFWEIDGSVSRHFAQWDIVTRTYTQITAPHVLSLWSLDDGRGIATEHSVRGGDGGVFQGSNIFAGSATASALNLFGPTNSLKGKVFTILIAQGALDPTAMTFGGVPSKLARAFAPTISAAPTVSFPYANAVIPMNLATQVADIPIKLIGKPSTAYQASWNGGATVAVGTADAHGVLDTVLPAQAKGNGTLTVAEVGGANAVTVANVAVGVVLGVLGESNPDGRGAMYPISIPAGFLRKDRANWTTLQAYGTGADDPVVPITTRGSGYTVGDVLTAVGGTGTPFQVKVTAVDGGGAITGLGTPATSTPLGAYSIPPANPTALSGGTGSGAAVSPVYSIGNQYWLAFVQKLYDHFGAVIGVTQVTRGSTYFFRTGTGDGSWSPTPAVGAEVALAATARSQLLGLQADFLTPNFILFDLGLNDMSLATTQAQYAARQAALPGFLQAGLANPNLRLWSILSGGEDGAVASVNFPPIRAAQLAAWNTAGSGYTPFGSFAHLHADLSDNVHFSSQATKAAMGAILYRYAAFKWEGGAQNRAPQFASASVSGNQVTVTFTGGVAPLTHAGADVNGWTLVDGNGPRTITSVSVSGLTVTLTADQGITTAAGSRTLSWCADKTCIGTTLQDSDATTPLPPEPFVSQVF